MIELTEFERAVLAKLLAGDHVILDRLRLQLADCQVKHRELTGHGFFTYLYVDVVKADIELNGHFGDLSAEVNGIPDAAGFELYIEQGKLYMLEGFGFDDPWPNVISSYRLTYMKGEERDWSQINELR